MVFRPLIPSRYIKLDVVQLTCRAFCAFFAAAEKEDWKKKEAKEDEKTSLPFFTTGLLVSLPDAWTACQSP